MYSSSSPFFDGYPAEHVPSFQLDPALLNSEVSGVSVSLHKDSEGRTMLPEKAYYSSDDARSSLICSRQLDLNPSRDNTTGHSHPASSSCGYHEWNLNSGHQAKRARVEHIVKGMTSSHAVHRTDGMTSPHEESGGMLENESVQDQELVDRSGSGSRTARKQLESQHQHLRQLRTRLNMHVGGVTDIPDSQYPTWSDSPETSPRDAFTDSYSEFQSSPSRKYQGWKKVKLMNYFQSKPERIKLMADVLKYELSRAVSRSVDSVFKSVPLLQASANDEGNASPQPPGAEEEKDKRSCCGNAETRGVPGVQTEALSLVVQKPRLERDDQFILHRPDPPVPFSHDSALCGGPDHSTEHALRSPRRDGSEDGRAKFEKHGTHWNSVKVRSKVNSRSVRSPQTHAASVGNVLLESSSLPRVKMESEGLRKNNLYMLNVSLTLTHFV